MTLTRPGWIWIDEAAPQPTAPPQCGVFYRLRTAEETGGVQDEAQLKVGGLYGILLGGGGGGDQYVHFELGDYGGYQGGYTFDITSPLIAREVCHDFRDWGTRRSRCERCGAWGHWDMATGRYTE
jgi:hypothetical protein